MTSLLTNVSSMSTLRLMAKTQKDVAQAEAQASSGLRIATASDGAAYWSIGTKMKSQVGALSEVQTGLALTSSIANVTAVALASVRTSLEKMQNDLVTARQQGVNLAAMQTDISAQQHSILDVVNSASFNGINWLIDNQSSDQSFSTYINVDVSKADYEKIGLGLEPNQTSTFDSTITSYFNNTDKSNNYTSQHTVKYHTVRTDAQDGTVTADKQRTPPKGFDGFDAHQRVDVVVVPESLSAEDGLVTSSFSLDPLRLFTDYNGSKDETRKEVYAGVTTVDTHEHINNTTVHSYDQYSNINNGILDGVITLNREPIHVSSYTKTFTPSPVVAYSTVPTVPVATPLRYSFTGDDTGGESIDNPPPPSVTPAAPVTVTPAAPVTVTIPGYSQDVSIQESILTMDISKATAADLDILQQGVQTAIGRIINASAVVGSLQNRLETQKVFNSALSDALTSGVGSLQDADMSVVSTRLQALQTQQQLQTQSLSIANQNTSVILKLFG